MSKLVESILEQIIKFKTISTRDSKSEFVKCFEQLVNIANQNNLFHNQITNDVLCISNNNINLENDYYGIYTHIDVVDVDYSKWNSDPFSLTIKNGYYYGRGVIDNKSMVAIAIYNLIHTKSNKNWVLFIGSNEEVSMNDIKIVNNLYKPPVFAYTPDGLLGICISEPTIITYDVIFENKYNEDINGGFNYNSVLGEVIYNGTKFIGTSTHIKDINKSHNPIYDINCIKNEKLNKFLSGINNHKTKYIDDKYFQIINIGSIWSNDKYIVLKIDHRFDSDIDSIELINKLKYEYTIKEHLNLRGYNKVIPNELSFLNQYKSIGGTYARIINNCFVIGPQEKDNTINGPHSDNECFKIKNINYLINYYENIICKF